MDLTYRSGAGVEDLQLNECVMRTAVLADGTTRFWHLWFLVARATDNQPEAFCVPMAPNGPYTENGPGGRTWGLGPAGPGRWQVSPSINVLVTREAHPGEKPDEVSLWHQTPAIIGVPTDEPWAIGRAP
jgi:hypothetical protein